MEGSENAANTHEHLQKTTDSNEFDENRSQIDRNEVLSEFGGPEDFTEHLSEYMLGHRQWKQAGQAEETDEVPQVHKGERKGNQIDNHAQVQQAFDDNHAGGINEDSLFEPLSSSTPPSRSNNSVQTQQEDASPQLPSPSLQNPKTRRNSESEGDVFRRVSALQAELEKMRLEEQKRLQTQEDLVRENEELRKENDEAHKRFEEIEKLSQTDTEEIQHRKIGDEAADNEVEKLHATIKNLKEALHATQTKLNDVQSEYEELIDTESEEIARLREELEEQKGATEAERNKSFVIAREAAKLAEAREQNELTIGTLQEAARSGKTDFDRIQGELKETRRILREVEDENENLLHKKEHALTVTATEKQLDTKTTELRAAHVTIAELRSKVKQDAQHDDLVEQQAAEIEALHTRHENSIASLKNMHASDIEKLTAALRAVTQSRHKSEAEVKQNHATELGKLQDRISTLEKAEETPSTHSIEDELRTAIHVLNNKISSANNAARSARLDAEAARHEAAEVAETNKSINEELEKGFSQAIEKREAEWHRRVQLLFKERDRMAKALLREWGRDEVGKMGNGERQPYRYKHISR